MGFILDAISELSEQMLVEDKMVKYNGEVPPKFGWCVIYIGGPASGKSTATNYLSRLHGDYYNVDNLKEIKRMWNITDPRTGKPHKDNFKTPEDKRVLSNPEFVNEIHREMKPLSKKWKDSMLNNPGSTEEERLPNMIFDITGDKINKISEIVDTVKPKGYRIAIIWVLTTLEKAIENSGGRDRQVDLEYTLIPKHKNVLSTVEEIFSSGYITKIDEFWVINSAIEINPQDNPREYHDVQNVYHIPTNDNGLKKFKEIISIIDSNKRKFKQLNTK